MSQISTFEPSLQFRLKHLIAGAGLFLIAPATLLVHRGPLGGTFLFFPFVTLGAMVSGGVILTGLCRRISITEDQLVDQYIPIIKTRKVQRSMIAKHLRQHRTAFTSFQGADGITTQNVLELLDRDGCRLGTVLLDGFSPDQIQRMLDSLPNEESDPRHVPARRSPDKT